MHLHFERNGNAKCDCSILSLSWMGKVPDELPEEEGWKLNRNNYYQEGWLATGNVRGVVGVTFTSSHNKRNHDLPLRSNYNLRGHRSEVILVKWNEPYQKLASCDKSGVIFVWIKYEGRWSIELINDRSTPVTHFSWSHDGRMALICYRDGFVLVGSVAGQRYWSSMLSHDEKITSGCWTPDDSQVYLGTASAELVIMDVHGAMISQVQLLATGGITSMAWSCEKFKMEEGEDTVEPSGRHVLAVALGNGTLVFMRGHDDVSPVRVSTNMRGHTMCMEWANSKELLAVAGALNPENTEDSQDSPPFKNVVKFYSSTGSLIYTVPIPYTQSPVCALTWGHLSRRVFVSVGGRVWVGRVWRAVAPLQLLARLTTAHALSSPLHARLLPLPPALTPMLDNLFAQTIRCNVPEPQDLRNFVSRPPAIPSRLHCTMLRHDDDEAGAYTLYLEHLGGLVPLLKGRRTSKIRPEFVIFDPQAEAELKVATIQESSSSSSGSSAGSGGTNSLRNHNCVSDSSDTERDEGCSGSPRVQRRRRARRKTRNQSEKEESDELAYVDSLPEDTRLVEVTSNIWGTKFKIHGLAKNVPANLGQITYKTSLLHLQPRQMTLMITELKDDQPVGPDPNFNPNIFSEDEEDPFPANEENNNPKTTTALTFAERCEEKRRTHPYTHPNQIDQIEEENIVLVDVMESPHSLYMPPRQAQFERRVVNPTNANRQAISPLRCESSVPTLQSPKNAVATTDMIFERPSPQTVSCGGRSDFYGGRSEFSLRTETVTRANVESQSINLNLSHENTRPVTIKKIDMTETCLAKLRKNRFNRTESSTEINPKLVKRNLNRNFDFNHPSAVGIGSLSVFQRNDDLIFIDEEPSTETSIETNNTNNTDRVKDVRVQRTPTVVPISPVCATIPTYNTMTRSCSVGYLDLVDPQVLHAQDSLNALNGEQPRRLILVPNKKQRRHRRCVKATDMAKINEIRTPSLKKCGKSKSLDSSELIIPDVKGKKQSKSEIAKDIFKAEIDLAIKNKKRDSDSEIKVLTPIELNRCSVCRAVIEGADHICEYANSRTAQQSDSDYSKYYRSLEQLALRLVASRTKRKETSLERESCSAPASPRPARTEKTNPPDRRQRYSSASPIRQLLNSPLLNRRRNKKPSESSDEENSNGYSEVNGKNFRDLESFQKAQLRNKLKRATGISHVSRIDSDTRSDKHRRQLVMHNKAPMWNENSQVYQLDFGGRVTQESAKNFQIEYHGKQVMQFGRIDGNAYTLDFQHPFSALQAFAVALANVTQRLK